MKTPLHTAGWGVDSFAVVILQFPRARFSQYLRATKDEGGRTDHAITTVVSCNSDCKSKRFAELARPRPCHFPAPRSSDIINYGTFIKLFPFISQSSFLGLRSVVPILTSVRLSPVSFRSLHKARSLFQDSGRVLGPALTKAGVHPTGRTVVEHVRRSQNLVNHCQCQSVGPAISPTALP